MEEEGRALMMEAETHDTEQPTTTMGSNDIVEKQMSVQLGAYSSVFVAAMGQITYRSPGEVTAKVHPCVLLLLAMPLYMTQLTALLSLRADVVRSERISVLDTTTNGTNVSAIHVLRHSTEDVHLHTHLSLKILFIIIVQVMYFDYIMHTLRKILFLLNPAMWVELHIPETAVPDNVMFAKLYRIIYNHKFWLLSPALIAMLMRFSVTYFVIVDSISIILISRQVTDTIWDCLAITFLLELNAIYWKVLNTLFHLEPLEMTDVTIMYNKGVWKEPLQSRTELSTIGRQHAICPRVVNLLSKHLPCRDGHQGRRTESIMVSIITYFLALRQVGVVAYALETNVSPMARDMCTEWRVQESNPFMKWLIGHVFWVDFKKMTDDVVNNHLGPAECNEGGKYYRTVMSGVMTTASGNPILFVAMAVIIFVVLVTPALTDLAPNLFLSFLIKRQDRSRKELEDRVATLEKFVEELQNKKQ